MIEKAHAATSLFDGVDTTNISGVTTLLNNAILIAASIAGAVSVIFIIVGAIQYITSGGGDGVKKAKTTLTMAIVGLVLSVTAFGLVTFISGSLQK